jgi:hypothetical protein
VSDALRDEIDLDGAVVAGSDGVLSRLRRRRFWLYLGLVVFLLGGAALTTVLLLADVLSWGTTLWLAVASTWCLGLCAGTFGEWWTLRLAVREFNERYPAGSAERDVALLRLIGPIPPPRPGRSLGAALVDEAEAGRLARRRGPGASDPVAGLREPFAPSHPAPQPGADDRADLTTGSRPEDRRVPTANDPERSGGQAAVRPVGLTDAALAALASEVTRLARALERAGFWSGLLFFTVVPFLPVVLTLVGLPWWTSLLVGIVPPFAILGGTMSALAKVQVRSAAQFFEWRFPEGSTQRGAALEWLKSCEARQDAGKKLLQAVEQTSASESQTLRRHLARLDREAQRLAPPSPLDPPDQRPTPAGGGSDITTDPRGDHAEGIRPDT